MDGPKLQCTVQQRQQLVTKVAKIPSGFPIKCSCFVHSERISEFWTLEPEFLCMFAHIHCASKGVPWTCWNYDAISPDLTEISGACSRCVMNTWMTAVAILFINSSFMMNLAEFWNFMLLTPKSMSCSTDCCGKLCGTGYRLLIIKESESPLKITGESKISSFITFSLPFIHFFSCIRSCGQGTVWPEEGTMHFFLLKIYLFDLPLKSSFL